jgi:hypothetical protein
VILYRDSRMVNISVQIASPIVRDDGIESGGQFFQSIGNENRTRIHPEAQKRTAEVVQALRVLRQYPDLGINSKGIASRESHRAIARLTGMEDQQSLRANRLNNTIGSMFAMIESAVDLQGDINA